MSGSISAGGSGFDESGSGSALSSITSAAQSIGSAAIPSLISGLTTSSPQTTTPGYSVNAGSTSATTSSSTILIIVVVVVLAIGAIFFLKK